MVIGTVKNGDGLGNGVVFDTTHTFMTKRTSGGISGNGSSGGNDGVNVLGGVGGNKVSKNWG